MLNSRCEWVEERLKHAIKNRTVSHAYVFEAMDKEKTLRLALEFAEAVLCENFSVESPGLGACGHCPSCHKAEHGNHEDLIFVRVEGAFVKNEAIQALQARLKKKPYVGSKNIAIIQGADSMTQRAQGRLLKTLEEPAGDATLVLLSENTENLLPTVLSRCIVLRLEAEPGAEREATAKKAALVGRMLVEHRAFYEIVGELTEVLLEKEHASYFLDSLELWYRDLLVVLFDQQGRLLGPAADGGAILQQAKSCRRDKIPEAIRAIEEARRELNRNVKAGYVLKGLILRLL